MSLPSYSVEGRGGVRVGGLEPLTSRTMPFSVTYLCLSLTAILLVFVSCLFFNERTSPLLSPVSFRPIEGGVRVCGDAVLSYFWCGFAVIFILTRGIAGFKTLCGLRLLQPLSLGFRWKKKVSVVITLFRTIGIRLFCKRKPSVLFCNASGFIISAYNNCKLCGLQLRPFPVNT